MMSQQVKIGVVIGVSIIGAGLGYKFLGGSRREKALGTFAGGAVGFGVSRFVTSIV